MRVTRRQRRTAYRIARQAWLDSHGDGENAEYKARAVVNDLELPPWLIEILITIIVQLIVKWITDQILVPEEMPLEYLGEEIDG